MWLEAPEECCSCFPGRDWDWITRNLLSLVKLYQSVWIWNMDQNLSMVSIIVSVFYTVLSKTLQGKRYAIFPSKFMKLTRAACWINSKISNKDKNNTLMIYLFCRYCLSLCCNHWRSLIQWKSTSWSRLTVQIKLALYPCDLFLINKSQYDWQ